MNATIDTLTLGWTYYNPGDYNLDGVVTGADVFPLALHFNQQSNYNGNEQTSEGNDCIDGNEDGLLNGMDMFPIVANYQNRVDGWYFYRDLDEQGEFADLVGGGMIRYEVSPCGTRHTYPVHFEFLDAWYYGSRAVDEVRDVEGPLSDVFLPHYWKFDVLGEGNSSSIAYSPDGWLCMAWCERMENEKRRLVFSRFWDHGYEINYVDPVGYYGGGDPSLAFGPDSNPAISYYYYGDGSGDIEDLRFVQRVGNDWLVETVDTEGNTGIGNSLAFGPDGEPAISYQKQADWKVKFASRSNGEWAVVYPDPEADVRSSTSLAFTPDGSPAICYVTYPENELRYATFDGENWAIETVRVIGTDDGDVCLKMAPDGRPAIAYLDSTSYNGYLKYARIDGSNWEIETLDCDGHKSAGWDPSLVYDSGGNPAIGYWDQYHSNLKFTRFDGERWQVFTVDDEEKTGMNPSLAVSADGAPAISYTWRSSYYTYKVKLARYY